MVMTRRNKLLKAGGCNTRSGKSTGGTPAVENEVNKSYPIESQWVISKRDAQRVCILSERSSLRWVLESAEFICQTIDCLGDDLFGGSKVAKKNENGWIENSNGTKRTRSIDFGSGH